MDIGKALRNTSKGKLKYDKYWVEEGRTKEILENVSGFSTKVAINVSPKILSQVVDSICEEVKVPKDEYTVMKTDAEKITMRSKDVGTYFYELQSEMELPILEYEEERLKYIQDIFEAKKAEFQNYSKNLQQQTEQQYNLLKRNNELDGKRRAADLKKIEDAIIEEAKQHELLQQQHIQNQAKKLSAIVQEAELKQKKAEEELRRREQEQIELLNQLNNCKLDAENLVCQVLEKLKSCEHPSFLRISVNERANQLTKFLDDVNCVTTASRTKPLTIEDILKTNEIVQKIYEAVQDISNDIELAKIKAVQDHEKQLKVSTEVPLLSKENKSSDVKSNTFTETKDSEKQTSNKASKSSKEKINNEAKAVLSTFIAPDVVEDYYKIMEFLKTTQNNIQAFIDDPRNKKYRFELQKSINVPINAISSVSGSHVRDKISRLLGILSSRSVGKESTNDAIVHQFCANLIAKKFVEQGDKQVSAQHATAFPIALAIIGVWIKKPEVGSLILGHFYTNCPYLVPFYPPRKENQSDREYYECNSGKTLNPVVVFKQNETLMVEKMRLTLSLGYYFDKEGNMEAKHKFLSRMSGFMRLYSAILLAPVPPSSVKYPHPHGIIHGWYWLSRILNLEPRPDITATLLYDFLEVTGHALQNTYGKQFKKLLHIICKDFFQKIKRVTPSGSGGPVERLETFLQQTIKKGFVPRPEGILDAAFWNR